RKRGEAGVSRLAAAVSAIVARRSRPDRGRGRRRRRRAAAFYFGVAGVTRKGISSRTIGMSEPSGASVTKTERVCAQCGATVFADAPGAFCRVCLFRTGLGSFDDEKDEVNEASRMQLEFGDY